MLKKISVVAFGLISIASLHGTAQAAVGKRDLGGYVGADTRAGGLQLPTTGANSFLTLPADADSNGDIADVATLGTGGEDSSYGFAIPNSGLYGTGLSNCAVHTNGIITCGQTPGALFDNGSLPDTRFAGGTLIAPFWDDLSPVGGLSKISYESKSGSWFAVQWNDFSLQNNPAARVTFRVTFQVNPTANHGAVIFQYIKMTGTGADGASATIGIQGDKYFRNNVYTVNKPGAVLTGTAAAGAALQAVYFDFDTDGDKVGDLWETMITTNPANHDTDGGGLDDGAELAGGKDPLVAGDDAAGADDDGDGLSALDEAFYGTDPAKADTDGDSVATTLSDSDELYTYFTDPLRKDSDVDQIDDDVEINAGADPLDPFGPQGAPSAPLMLGNNGTLKYDVQTDIDSNGNIHVVTSTVGPRTSGQHSLLYYMLDPTGAVLIPETLLKGPSDSGRTRAYRIRVYNNKVYVTYEWWKDNLDGAGKVALYILDPSTAPQNGSAVPGSSLIEFYGPVVSPSSTHIAHHELAVGASGIYLAFQTNSEGETHHSTSGAVHLMHLGLDGSFASDKEVFTYTWGRRSAATYLALDAADTAHLVTVIAATNDNQSLATYYSAVAGNVVQGPHYLSLPAHYATVAMKANLLYIGFLRPSKAGGRGIGLSVLDTTNYTVIPRVGDANGVKTAIDLESMSVPPTVQPAPVSVGRPGMVLLPNGGVLFRTTSDDRRNNQVCFGGLGADGSLGRALNCYFGGGGGNQAEIPGQSGRQTRRFLPSLMRLPDGSFASLFIHTRRRMGGNHPIYFSTLPASFAQFPAPTVNLPPKFTSTAPAPGAVGSTFSYTATATDAETPAGSLVFSLVAGPDGMTVSPTGAVDWTVAAGGTVATIQVCDGGGRCVTQTFSATPGGTVAATDGGMMPGVAQPMPPVITSVPVPIAFASTAYAYQVTATDPNNDPITYTLDSPSPAPGDLAISATGLISYNPDASQVGQYVVSVRAADGTGRSATQTYTLSVLPGDSIVAGPTIQFVTTPRLTAVVGESYAYQATASNGKPGTSFTYTLTSTPVDDATVSSAGVLQWTPSKQGTYSFTITATAMNGESASQSFAVTAADGGGCSMTKTPSTSGLGTLVLVALALLLGRRRRIASLLAVLAFLFPSSAQAALGKRDLGGYIGVDSRAPAVQLPASYLTLPTPDTTATVANTAQTNAAGDDGSFNVNLGAASAYGSSLNSCRVYVNGYITCGGDLNYSDNRALPDGRFGGAFLFAPFWDDLVPVPGLSTITTETKTGEWIAVQWNDFAAYANGTARLTFRATFQLDEPNNDGAVSFSYIKMTGQIADGRSATIGVQSSSAYAFTQYSTNKSGAILTGTAAAGAALQTILIGYDSDGDRLPGWLEATLGSSDTDPDSDDGGLDDGAEVALGKNPTSAADDGTQVDTDMDGLSDADEAFYGTDPAKKDTDADSTATTSLNDLEELYNQHTDPTNSDTDGDFHLDGDEIDAATGPLNPTDPGPPGSLVFDNGPGMHFPQAVVDSEGRIHVVAGAHNNELHYTVIGSAGNVLVPRVIIKSVGSSTIEVRRPQIGVIGGKVYVVYEAWDNANSRKSFGIVRINPTAAPNDGTPIFPNQIVEQQSEHLLAWSTPSDSDVAFGNDAIWIVYREEPSMEGNSSGGHRGIGYARFGLDGALLSAGELFRFGGTTPLAKGVHKGYRAAIAADASGNAHVVFTVRTGGPDKDITSGLYYAALSPSKISGPHYMGPGKYEKLDVQLRGSFLHLALSGGGSSLGQSGLSMAILDTARYVVLPRVGDMYGAFTAIDPESFYLPITRLQAGYFRGARVAPLTNGASVLYTIGKGDNNVCIGAMAPNGQGLGQVRCVLNGQNAYNGHYHSPVLLNTDGSIGFLFASSKNSATLRYARFAANTFPLTNPPAGNAPPLFTTVAPTVAFVSSLLTYTPKVNDPEGGTLSFSLLDGPQGAALDATTGKLTWTPTMAQIGSYSFGIRVCDDGTPVRCSTQPVSLKVPTPGMPAIVSTPPTVALVGKSFAYQAVVDSNSSDVASWTLTAPSPAPGNLAIDAKGLMSWIPTEGDLGTHVLTIRATNAAGLSAEQSFTLSVVSAGDATSSSVVFTSVPPDLALRDEPFTYKVEAIDEGDATATFTYALRSTPSGNLAVATDGTVTWTPTGDEPDMVTITVEATSSHGGVGMQTFNVRLSSSGCSCDLPGKRGPTESDLATLALALLGFGVYTLRRRSARTSA